MITVLAGITHTGRLLIAIFAAGVSGILVTGGGPGDHPHRLSGLAKIGLVLLSWLALTYAGFSLLVAVFVLGVGAMLVSLIRAGDHPHRLPVIAEIGVVLLCWLAVAYAGLSLLPCIGDEQSTQRLRVCYSMSAAYVYVAVMAAAAAIPLITVLSGHFLGRRRVALTGCLVSVAAVAAVVIWGVKTGSRPV